MMLMIIKIVSGDSKLHKGRTGAGTGQWAIGRTAAMATTARSMMSLRKGAPAKWLSGCAGDSPPDRKRGS